MIEEQAQVVAMDKTSIWVEAKRESACGRCAANKGCGNSVFQNVFGNKTTVLPVQNTQETDSLSINVGDEVVIGVDENALVRNSLLVYAVPIVTIILFAALGETFANQVLSISRDAASIGGALMGLMTSIVLLRMYNRLAARKPGHQPVLLRRIEKPTHHLEIKILG